MAPPNNDPTNRPTSTHFSSKILPTNKPIAPNAQTIAKGFQKLASKLNKLKYTNKKQIIAPIINDGQKNDCFILPIVIFVIEFVHKDTKNY